MDRNSLNGLNIEFPIYKADGSSFYGLILRRATFDSVVMSLGDKITGDIVYSNNALPVSMGEYIMFAGVKYTLVNPPTVVREGLAKDNSDLKGMTKYSFEFYHPMYQLGNLPFYDVAVSSDQQRYLSENKVFSWIGKPDDYITKLNKNLENTQWVVVKSDEFPVEKLNVLSDVLSFDKATIADALKTWYDTWKIPYVVDTIDESDPLYAQGKRFKVVMGLPSNEILDSDDNPYIFEMGQGVGLKNNSRTPKNNKIVTRIAPYGSERNIPYGYPQIVWTGNQDWEYTIDNDPTAANSYPIYDGIVGGQNVRLIKHPFTRKTLMPSIYATLVNKKVNPNATGYDPTIELVDYYDATSEEHYPNPINPLAPSYEAHEFSDIYPRLDEKSILSAEPYDTLEEQGVDGYVSETEFLGTVLNNSTSTKNSQERTALLGLYNALNSGSATYHAESQSGDDYQFVCDVTSDDDFYYVKYTSSNINYDTVLLKTGHTVPVASSWNDKMDDEGNYEQSYFKITLPLLNFDMYACASITEDMKIYMRSGACIGCTFNVAVDWDDYKKNFYDADGKFAPEGSQRDLTKYPKTNEGSVTIIVQKDIDTFGTLMPNIYQQPTTGDEFVVLGISLPLTYITDAEAELDAQSKQYMLENNVYYYEYPLKFDEHFLAKNTDIIEQIKPNSIVRFKYNGEQDNIVLYVKQMTVKYGQGVLPQYDITVTDDIEVVLNKIGQVTDDVSRMRFDIARLMQLYTEGVNIDAINRLISEKLSKIEDDTAQGFIRFMQGIQVGERFVSGILGEGGVFRRNADGKVYLETDNLYVRMKAYFDTIEVRHYKHSTGNRIASNAGIHCSRVVWIDAQGNPTEDLTNAVKFRCYFRATDGEDTVANYFVASSDGTQDLAFCDKTTVESGVNNRRYWRAVVGKNAVLTNDGEAWIDLSKTDCKSGSDIPIAGDDIIQLGNKTDTERQGAIIEYVNGNDAPSYQIYQGINSYSLENKNIIRIGFNSRTGRAEMNVYGDAYIGDQNGSTYVKYNQATKKVEIKAEVSIQSTFGGHTFEERVAEYAPEYDDSWIQPAIDELQDQIDGAIETWFYDGAPTLSNLPASQWSTTDDKKNHLGDLYYDNRTGYAYRFSNTGTEQNPQFEWKKISDQDVTKALADAAKAQATADGKMTIYSLWGAWVKNSVNTLQVGDLFIPANDTTQGGVTYKARKVYKCTTAGQNSFVEINYTDDSTVRQFIDVTFPIEKQGLQNQIDGKIESWFSTSDPASSWTDGDTKAKHVGDMWYNSSVHLLKRYTFNGSTYSWETVEDQKAIDAYNNAATAQDTANGKRTVFTTQPTPPYMVGDLWAQGTSGDIMRCINARADGSYVASDWEKASKYTDDSALTTFLAGYQGTAQQLKNQIDKKAETWYQSTDPARAQGWVDTEHVGDLWMDTSSNGGKKTYVYVDKGASANPRYTWEEQNVPTEVFNKIDGKSSIFISQPSNYKANDLWILASDTTLGAVTYKQGDILTTINSRTTFVYSDWWKMVRYTDDTYAHGFDFLTSNLARLSSTEISGGLVLSSLIGLRDTNNLIQSGINGIVESAKKGNGIAAWYGGEQGDLEDQSHYTGVTRWAKSLFRFDGSGYLAGGNISWNSGNNLKINLKSDSTSGIPSFKMLSGNSNESLVLEESQSSGDFVKWYGLAASSEILNYQGDFLTVGVNVRSDNTGRAKIVLCDTVLSSNVPIAPNVSILTPDFLAFRYREQGASETIGTLATIGIYNTGSYAGYIDLRAQKWLRRAIKNDGNFDSGTAYVDTYGYLRVKDFGDTNEGNPSGETIGSVTSVGLSAPTGFQVSNSPITTSGNIVLSFASGYSLPTTAKQNNWDTAYGWGNHANAGYLTSNSLSGYATQSWVGNNYLPLTGGTMTGDIFCGSLSNGSYRLFNDGIEFSYGNSRNLSGLFIGREESAYEIKFTARNGQIVGTTINLNSVTSGSFIKSGGTSAQFLKADGSVDSNSYITTSALSGYLPLTGGTLSSSNNVLSLNSSTQNCWMYFNVNNVNKTSIGYYNNLAFIANENTYARIGVADNGTPQYWPNLTSSKYTLLHSGNVKTINGNSIMGTGDITIGGGGTLYDAEIEYLENSSASQLIDTNYIPQGNGVEIGGSFYYMGYYTSNQWTPLVYHTHVNESTNTFRIIRYANTNDYIYINNNTITGGGGTQVPISLNTKNDFVFNDNGYTFNGVQYARGSSRGAVNTASLTIFSEGHIRIYSFYIKKDGALVRDFIPVRVGQVGYLYDKVSGELFGNSGTGSFVLGADKEYLPITGGTITGNLTVRGTLTASDGDLDIYSTGNQGGRGTIFNFKQHQDVYFNSTGEYFFYAALNAPAFNNTSDLRKKTIIGDVPINLYNVANAPLFKFTWKDEKKYSGQHIGSAAQYWQTVLPELVSVGRDADMTLAMQYDVIALASAITVAKTVVSHEERIKILENENKSLKEEIELLKNKS